MQRASSFARTLSLPLHLSVTQASSNAASRVASVLGSNDPLPSPRMFPRRNRDLAGIGSTLSSPLCGRHYDAWQDRYSLGFINGTTTEFRHARSWHKNKGRFPTVSRKLPTLTLVNLFGCGWRDLEPANEAHSRLQICADGKEPFARFIVRVWMCRFCRLC